MYRDWRKLENGKSNLYSIFLTSLTKKKSSVICSHAGIHLPNAAKLLAFTMPYSFQDANSCVDINLTFQDFIKKNNPNPTNLKATMFNLLERNPVWLQILHWLWWTLPDSWRQIHPVQCPAVINMGNTLHILNKIKQFWVLVTLTTFKWLNSQL